MNLDSLMHALRDAGFEERYQNSGTFERVVGDVHGTRVGAQIYEYDWHESTRTPLDSPRISVELPHQCDAWEVGTTDTEVRDLIDELAEARRAMANLANLLERHR